MNTRLSRRSLKALMAASVKVAHPSLWWLLASCARTVSVALSSSTPWSAQRVRSPFGGMGLPKSSSISLKMLTSEGGAGMPSGTEKLSPMACPGS